MLDLGGCIWLAHILAQARDEGFGLWAAPGRELWSRTKV